MNYKDMNPTRLVSLGIGAFAVIGIVAVSLGAGDGWSGGASRDEGTAAAELAAAEDEGDDERSARVEATDDEPRSTEFDAWVDNADAESDDEASPDDEGTSDGEAAFEDGGRSEGEGERSESPSESEVAAEQSSTSE